MEIFTRNKFVAFLRMRNKNSLPSGPHTTINIFKIAKIFAILSENKQMIVTIMILYFVQCKNQSLNCWVSGFNPSYLLYPTKISLNNNLEGRSNPSVSLISPLGPNPRKFQTQCVTERAVAHYTSTLSVGVGRMFGSVCLFVCLSVCFFVRSITQKRTIPMFKLDIENDLRISWIDSFGVENSKVKVTASISAFSQQMTITPTLMQILLITSIRRGFDLYECFLHREKKNESTPRAHFAQCLWLLLIFE